MLGEKWRDPIDITKERWMIILGNRDITREKDVRLLEMLYSCSGYRATAKQLARLLHMPSNSYPLLNIQAGRLGKRIVKELNISAPKHKHGKGRGKESNWWNVPFWGETKKEGEYWILRPELAEAMQELERKGEILIGYGASLPEEVDLEGHENLYEGARKQIYVNSYERNNRARYLCIAKYGIRCVICDFDFEKVYGEIGRNFIHVHHLTPLSQMKQKYQIDLEEHLRPICPNCHAIVHKKNPPYSIDEVIAMMRNARME